MNKLSIRISISRGIPGIIRAFSPRIQQHTPPGPLAQAVLERAFGPQSGATPRIHGRRQDCAPTNYSETRIRSLL